MRAVLFANATATTRLGRRRRSLTHEHDQSLASGDAGIVQIALQHRIVLRHHRQGIPSPGSYRHQGVEFAEGVGDWAPIETGSELTVVGGDVAVVDLLVLIVVNRARYGIVNTIN